MFPSFIGILDIQSWWEVPSIAYFCSLFRTAFNLLDFDIEELEEALLTDGTEESASSLLTELIVRLLNGCLGNNDISAFNYQMYLRRLFRRKCQETRRYNPFDSDIDFQFLPLRTKVEILYALCDFRLDAEDVFDLFKNLEAESLRVEPLGWDDNESAYWYFYGTRLYREDILKKPKGKGKKRKSKKRGWFYGEDWLDDEETERVWQVVCFTEEDWIHLTEKFSKATSKIEKELYRSLSQNFLPEIPRLFQEKERLQRKRLLELAPRRTSSRVLQKIKQKEEEEEKSSSHDTREDEDTKETPHLARENRAKRRNLLRSKSASSESTDSSVSVKVDMPLKIPKRSKSQDKRSKNISASQKGEPPPEQPIKTGRKTNNSLASATGQILIPDNDEPVNSTRKKLKTSQIFSQTEEDIQTDMYKVLEQLTNHEDAWPFMDPVEEEYAPNYYAVIRRPMDLRKMEERLDSGFYTDFSMFKADFKLIVNNCRLYNGQDNEYTTMVDNLQTAFDRLTEKYMHRLSSSDEEIAVEYQLPTPSRKHKLKPSESPSRHKRKKRKSHSESGEPKSSTSDHVKEEEKPNNKEEALEVGVRKSKESHKSTQGKGKKKRKGHHRHGKHSKNHKKDSHKSEHNESSKSKHNKKQKHTKNKESKKSKQKKKKSKHHELETTEPPIKRSASQESLESSNRSRSASPLPSIHTPSPSPTELEPPEAPQDSDFFKDKYDKIKERRRHAAKDAWESLFDYRNKTVDKQKQNLNIPEKDKNQKLRETIEKLKAKNEKYRDSSPFNSLFSTGHGSADKNSDSTAKESNNDDDPDFSDIESIENIKGKSGKKGQKKSSAKNESASEALEQAVKDITKWLDDAPKASVGSSPCDSPAQTISTEEHDNSRLDDEFSQGEKSSTSKKEISRKRPSSREPKTLVKRREIQRTIDRLQPGKSKGNLLTNISNKSTEKAEEVAPLTKVRETGKGEEASPKLSLGSVLPTVEFTLGKDHKFSNSEDKVENHKDAESNVVEKSVTKEEITIEKKPDELKVQPDKKDVEIETDPVTPTKLCQEKATPNLSAWFKAFGAPKSTTTTTTTLVKKKVEDSEPDDKAIENTSNNDNKSVSPKNATKYDSPTDPDTPNPDGGESPVPNASATPRQRRTSTGSSVSERSSFSQDLDSPRHQMSHTSPLLRSPASPRTEDFQKITYPIINGTVRAGFYQDTTSIKSSPEKSCSPREAPQSPYSPYSQHVYASNNVMGSTTPNYFVDHNKSPLPSYGQNPPHYYDTSKLSSNNKPSRTNEDYTSLGPETFQQNPYAGPYSPAHSPYTQSQPSNYSQVQNSPQPTVSEPTPTVPPSKAMTDPKTTLFPVKKRTYNEPELVSPKKKSDSKENSAVMPVKSDYQKISQSLHSMSSLSTASVDDIALALSEKSEITKMNNLREKINEYVDRQPTDSREDNVYENNSLHETKKEPGDEMNNPISIINNDNVDMINMGYMNPELERRSNNETHEVDFALTRDAHKPNINTHHSKSYEVDSMAINLGMNNQQMQKAMTKQNIPSHIPPAHSHDRHSNSANIAHTHTHHSQYDPISGNQSVSNFSLNDIELANKKLYACNTSSASAALDYGNWKMGNQMRNKQDMLPSDYSNAYHANTDKLKPDISTATSTAINYNKNLQHQQYTSYNVPRTSIHQQRTHELQQNLPSELRIPNPRGLLKSDLNLTTSISDSSMIVKNMDTLAKSQKPEKLVQNHPLIGSMQYKPPYSTHSSIPLDSLRNLPNIPQMLERYTNDERYLSSFGGSSSALYHDKTFQMAQMFNKTMSPDVHATSASVSSYSQPATVISKDNNVYKGSSSVQSTQLDAKTKTKRKRTSDSKQLPIVGGQSYHAPPCNTDVLSSVKTSMMPGSAFSFGTSANMALGGGLYGDNSGFSIEDFRNSTANQLMAANYMAAAVAHQQRNSEASGEKIVKPAHQNSSHTSTSFPFMGHSQVRAGYPFVSTDPSSPLYQQYLQHQEELLRQTGAQIMGLYPPGYPASLGVRQPYDSINRPSWL